MSRRKTSPHARPGERTCLKCDKKFESEDVICNRICPKCNRDNRNVFLPRQGNSTVFVGGQGHTVHHDE